MRNAKAVIEAIQGRRSVGRTGVINTRRLMDEMRLEPETPVIHVAGTNGKGSVCAMLERILREAGYRTGLYTSPFLQVYNERICVNGAPVPDAEIEASGNPVLDIAERLDGEGVHCSFFELGTAMALDVFRRVRADVIVLETGLGGRFDATNAVRRPAVCAITAIGLDHMELLGNTLPEIASEKAGIIRENVPVVCQAAPPEVEKVFAQAAAEKHAPLTQTKMDWIKNAQVGMRGSRADYLADGTVWEDLELSLPGAHQTANALTALCVVNRLRGAGIAVPDSAVRYGMKKAEWPGRLEWRGGLLMDGAHNEQGMRALKQYTDMWHGKGRKVLLTGVMADKLTEPMLGVMASLADEAVTVRPKNPRSMSAEELRDRLTARGVRTCAAASAADGLRLAESAAGADGLVIAAGSLYFIGELRSL